MSKWLIHCKFTLSYSKYENMSIIRFDLFYTFEESQSLYRLIVLSKQPKLSKRDVSMIQFPLSNLISY